MNNRKFSFWRVEEWDMGCTVFTNEDTNTHNFVFGWMLTFSFLSQWENVFGLINNGHHCMMERLQEGEPRVMISLWSIVLNLGLRIPTTLINRFQGSVSSHFVFKSLVCIYVLPWKKIYRFSQVVNNLNLTLKL